MAKTEEHLRNLYSKQANKLSPPFNNSVQETWHDEVVQYTENVLQNHFVSWQKTWEIARSGDFQPLSSRLLLRHSRAGTNVSAWNNS